MHHLSGPIFCLDLYLHSNFNGEVMQFLHYSLDIIVLCNSLILMLHNQL
jgi:hypothetical protein